jgi:hypothetical protein
LKTSGPSAGRTLMTDRSRSGWGRRVLRLILPVVAVRIAVVGALLRLRDEVGASLVEQGDALLDALEGLGHVAFQALEDPDRVLVGAGPDAFGIVVGLADDPATLEIGGLGEPALVDEEGRLLLGLGDDALGLFLGLLDDPFALGVDALGRPDLLRDGDPQLVDEPERRVLVDDDVRGQGQLLPVGDERFETLDEEDDVDGGGPPARAPGLWHGALALSDGRAPRAGRRRPVPATCR